MKQAWDIELPNICPVVSLVNRIWTLVLSPLQPLRSLRSLAKADISGLSCILFPFLPRRPHRLVRLSSPFASDPPDIPFGGLFSSARELLSFGAVDVPFRYEDGVPPRIAATEECAHLACLRMAEVTVMHSVVIKATGSTAMAALQAKLW